MNDYEKQGMFYLGRKFDMAKSELGDRLLYDSRDLVTHGVCVGMTGSGKTGLCIGLLEEAAIDGVPSIVIDPKGDLANLLLTFPELRGEDFRPWVSEEEAGKQNISLDELRSEAGGDVEGGPGPMGPGSRTDQAPQRGCRVCRLHPGLHRRTAGEHTQVLRGTGQGRARRR